MTTGGRRGNEYEYVIPRSTTGGRRQIAVYLPLPDGAEEEVLTDVHVLPGGDIRVGMGTNVPDVLILDLR